jgi:hypothetical protein
MEWAGCPFAFAGVNAQGQSLVRSLAPASLPRPPSLTSASLAHSLPRHPRPSSQNSLQLAADTPGAGPIAILSGANGSGKSLYLKSVALLVLLAQAGSFVPAERVVLGLVDRIFSRLASLDSAMAGASSFSLDLAQVGLMLRHATPRSLLLIDEFGKGTASLDGIALLAATVRAFARGAPTRALDGAGEAGAAVEAEGEGPDGDGERGAAALAPAAPRAPPRTIITTHFREVFDQKLLHVAHVPAVAVTSGGDGDGAPPPPPPPPPPTADASAPPPHVAYFQMGVVLERRALSAGNGATDDEDDEDGSPAWDDSVVPLFRLMPGAAASSYGLACALRGGIPHSLVQRAADVGVCLRENRAVPPLLYAQAEDAAGDDSQRAAARGQPRSAAAAAADAARSAAALAAVELLMSHSAWANTASSSEEAFGGGGGAGEGGEGGAGGDLVALLELLRLATSGGRDAMAAPNEGSVASLLGS